jgi:hypothetical protein
LSLAISTFIRHSDPIFISILSDILETLSKAPSPGVYGAVVKQALPTLCYSLESAPLAESYIAASAIELISSLVKGSPESGLEEGFVALLAPSLFEVLGEAKDRDVLQVLLCESFEPMLLITFIH